MMPESKNRTYGYKTHETLIAIGGAHRLLMMVLILMTVMTMTMTMTSTTKETDDLECRPSNAWEDLESGQLSFRRILANIYI